MTLELLRLRLLTLESLGLRPLARESLRLRLLLLRLRLLRRLPLLLLLVDGPLTLDEELRDLFFGILAIFYDRQHTGRNEARTLSQSAPQMKKEMTRPSAYSHLYHDYTHIFLH